jgi:hypothetical protein
MKPNVLPPLAWWIAQNKRLQPKWDATPWHMNGDATLKPLAPEIRKHARLINELQPDFMTYAADQHLAVLSEDYRYECYAVTEDLGDGRLACVSVEGEEFALYSQATRKDLHSGNRVFFTALTEAQESGIARFITYGPILPWKGLRLEDMDFLARRIARDLYATQGFSAVARRNPVAFWASWRWGGAPKLLHGDDAIRTCQALGRLSSDFMERLDGAWEKRDAGAATRYVLRGEKPFFDRYIYNKRKTETALLSTSMESEFEALKKSLGDAFVPDPRGEERVSPLMELIWKELTGKELEYMAWARPFEPTKRAEDASNDSTLTRYNQAMPGIIEAVNAKREPDWIALGERYCLSSEDMLNLKELTKTLREKIQ